MLHQGAPPVPGHYRVHPLGEPLPPGLPPLPLRFQAPKLIWLPMSVPPGRAAMHGQIIASPQVDGIICRLWQHLPSAGGPDDAASPGRINHRFPRVDFRCRQQLARLFGCRPDHVCFTANSTEALNIALMGLLGPETMRSRP